MLSNVSVLCDLLGPEGAHLSEKDARTLLAHFDALTGASGQKGVNDSFISIARLQQISEANKPVLGLMIDCLLHVPASTSDSAFQILAWCISASKMLATVGKNRCEWCLVVV